MIALIIVIWAAETMVRTPAAEARQRMRVKKLMLRSLLVTKSNPTN